MLTVKSSTYQTLIIKAHGDAILYLFQSIQEFMKDVKNI